MLSNKEIYFTHLKSTPLLLRVTLEKLEAIIINLAMSDELAEVNDQFTENDPQSNLLVE